MQRIIWGVVIASAIFIGIVLPVSFLANPTVGILAVKSKELQASTLFTFSFYVHVILGGVALTIGWVGFSQKIRTKYRAMHKLLGKIYVLCYAITAATSILVSYHAHGGIVSQLGFITIAIIAFYSTLKGYLAIRQKDLSNHQKWMRYSYASCLASISLRIYMPLSHIFLADKLLAYQLVSWLAWLPNLAIAWYINHQKSNYNITKPHILKITNQN